MASFERNDIIEANSSILCMKNDCNLLDSLEWIEYF